MAYPKGISLTCWPVGQGLFTQFDVYAGDATFRVVYDCGSFTSGRGSPLDGAIRLLRDRPIDLLIISHFHYDHISGVPKLLDVVGLPRYAWVPHVHPQVCILQVIAVIADATLAGLSFPEYEQIALLAANPADWLRERGKNEW